MNTLVIHESAASAADTAKTVTLTPGDTQPDGKVPESAYYGHYLRILNVFFVWSAAVASVQHKITYNSGRGSSYDHVVFNETLSLTDLTWFPDFAITLFPRRGSILSDALDVLVGKGGSGITSQIQIEAEVIR